MVYEFTEKEDRFRSAIAKRKARVPDWVVAQMSIEFGVEPSWAFTMTNSMGLLIPERHSED